MPCLCHGQGWIDFLPEFRFLNFYPSAAPAIVSIHELHLVMSSLHAEMEFIAAVFFEKLPGIGPLVQLSVMTVS